MKYSLLSLLAGAISIAAFSSPAFADQQDFIERLNACKAISSLVTRAQCYDVVLDDYDPNTLKRRDKISSETWRVETKKSPMTDNMNVMMTLPSADLFTTKDNTQVRRFLIMSCNEGNLNVYVSWNTEIGMREGTVNVNKDNIVNWRLGSDPVVAETWPISADKTASFSPKPKDLYQKLLNANGLYVTTVWPTVYYNTVQATFDPRGLADKVKPLKDSCHLP